MSGRPVAREELGAAAIGMGGDPLEHVAEIGPRIEPTRRRRSRRSSPDVPHLRIVSDDLWERVQARKAKTRARYLRGADGTRRAKPEAGLVAAHLLNGIGRCGVCGGSLIFSAKNPTTRRYYCSTRLHRGACDNNRGVPEPALDRLVEEKVHGLLTEETVEVLYERAFKRDAEFKAALDGRSDARERAEREIARLEAMIARLTDAIEQGQPVGDRLTQRQAELKGLRVTLAVPAPTLSDQFHPDDERRHVELLETFSVVRLGE